MDASVFLTRARYEMLSVRWFPPDKKKETALPAELAMLFPFLLFGCIPNGRPAWKGDEIQVNTCRLAGT